MLNGLILYAIPYPAVELPFYMIITQNKKTRDKDGRKCYAEGQQPNRGVTNTENVHAKVPVRHGYRLTTAKEYREEKPRTETIRPPAEERSQTWIQGG